MPTIYLANGFQVEIYTRDHRPPHVHVTYQGTEVVIHLGEIGTDPEVHEVFGMKSRHVVKALEIVEDNQVAFRSEWRRIHGY